VLVSYRGSLESDFFNPVPGRILEATGPAYVVTASSAEFSSSMGCENEVKTSSSAEVSGSTGYENEARADSSAEVSDSSGTYLSVLSDGRLQLDDSPDDGSAFSEPSLSFAAEMNPSRHSLAKSQPFRKAVTP
jgi:hypothetical protein